MIKQASAIILLSIGVITAMTYAQQGLHYLLTAHSWVSEMLMEIFSGGNAGNLTRQLIALLAIPILVGLLVSILYWLIKHSWFPYFMQFVWVVWLIQTSALLVMQ
jgi:hypothetical protein